MGPLTWLIQFLLCFSQYWVAFSSSPLSSFSSSAHPLCRYGQRSALLQFKHMFTINSHATSECDGYYGIPSPSYPKTLSWDENATDCCNWDGVTCDGLTGHVIGLDLSCSQLYGKIRPNSSLFQLSHLQRLNLAHNDFNDSHISYGFGSFASLTHLNLSDSGFSGSIPSEISRLSKLISLDLSSTQLRLELPHFKIILKNLTQLQELILIHVNISSGSPDFLTNLSSLTALDLSWTGLQGNLPERVLHLPNLDRLFLQHNYHLIVNLPKSTWRNGSSLRVLDLSYTKFSGELPDSIGYLKSLHYLILDGCKLGGSVPKSLGNLTQIRGLSLLANDFHGEVPSTLSNLKQLTLLELASNNLEGRIPIFAELKKLEWLVLGNNNFTGPIPFNLSGLQNLRGLYLSNNSLNGVIPPTLFTLPSLRYLDLKSNCLTGQIPEFQNYLPLYVIDLSDNKLHGPIPQSISTLVNLTVLVLASNGLSGVVDLQIPKNVEYLSLSNTNLSVVAGSNVNNTLPNLKTFDMSSCNIEVFPNFLRASKNLNTLDLSHNRIHGPQCNTFPNGSYAGKPRLCGDVRSLICNLSSLEILVLSNNNLNGVIPQCLGNVSNALSVLDLRMNGFSGTIPKTFVNCNKLRSLNLNGNHLEGPVPQSLANCKSMEVLDLGDNNLNGAFPPWLESLSELQVLVLKLNKFHGPIGTSGIENPFPKLRIFDLSYNNFTGLLPKRYFLNFKAMMYVDESKISLQYMGDTVYRDSVELVLKGVVIELKYILTIFTTIDFSNNHFSGEIPNDVGKLQGLRLLNLSQNSLSGYLPSLLQNMTMLESLDLSSNQLTGKIPGELQSLTFLAVLNLSKNHLVGPIPRGNQFDTFQNDSYIENSGLCGLPLSKKCGDSEAQSQPPSQDDDEDEDDGFMSGFTWKIVLMGYGCGFVIGVCMGFVMFLTGRPRWYTRIVGGEPRRKVVRVNQIGWRSRHQSSMQF